MFTRKFSVTIKQPVWYDFRDGTPSSHTCIHTMVEQDNHRISILCIYASVTCLNFNIVMGWLIGGAYASL